MFRAFYIYIMLIRQCNLEAPHALLLYSKTGVYRSKKKIFFLFLTKTYIDCGYQKNRLGSNRYQKSTLRTQTNKKLMQSINSPEMFVYLKQKYFKDTTTGHYLPTYLHIYIYLSTGPDSSSGRASASGAVGRGLKSWPRHTKAIKMVLAARTTRVVIGR